MASSVKIDLLAGRVPSFEEFFVPESLTESLDFNMFLDGLSSIPLYERMDIKKEHLTIDELNKMDSEAKIYYKKYNKRLKEKCDTVKKLTEKSEEHDCMHNQSSHIKNNSTDTGELNVGNITFQVEELNKTTDVLNEDRGHAENFLKYLYNTKENNLLITTLQKNINFDIHPKSPEKSVQDNEINFTLQNMEGYLNDISNGKYDDFAFRHPSPLPSSSESESEEEINSKAREFSVKFKISTNAYKYAFLKSIVDDSLKNRDYVLLEKDKSQIQPPKWISSDDDSETEKLKVRQNELEFKRKKRKGTKNKNRSLIQSKQKNVTESKSDNTSQQKQDNVNRSKPKSPGGFTSLPCKNKDIDTKYKSVVDRNPHNQKPFSDSPAFHAKQSEYTTLSKEKVHDINGFHKIPQVCTTIDKGYTKKSSKNNSKVKEIKKVTQSSVIEKNPGLNVTIDKRIQNSKKEGFKENIDLTKNTKTRESEIHKKTPTLNIDLKEQIVDIKESTTTESSSRFAAKVTSGIEMNKLPSNSTKERSEIDFSKQFNSEGCSTLLDTIDLNDKNIKTEPENQNGSSSSSDEDWAKYAERSLSVVDKILKHTSKK